jgi:hypothetical protein
VTTTTNPETLRSTYTDDQLRDALITATELRERIFIRGTVGADGAYGSQHWSEDQINDLHTILHVLDSLTEDSTDASEDVWLRAESIADIRRGDMLKVEVDSLIGTYKYAVKDVSLSSKTIIFDNGDMYTWVEDDTVYRIPAPIVHPDPKEHRLIIVHEFDGKHAPEGSYASICQNFHGNPIYEYVPGDGSQTMTTSGAGITRWEPATVVPLKPQEVDHRG